MSRTKGRGNKGNNIARGRNAARPRENGSRASRSRSRNNAHRGKQQQQQQQQPKNPNHGRRGGGGGGRRDGRRTNASKDKHKHEPKKNLTAEDLDAAMDEYWMKSGNKETVNKKLDEEMDAYWEKKHDTKAEVDGGEEAPKDDADKVGDEKVDPVEGDAAAVVGKADAEVTA